MNIKNRVKQCYFKTITTLLLVVSTAFLLTACNSIISTSRSVIDSKNPGHLISFSYYFGSYTLGYWEYKIYERNGNICFTAKGMNGIDLNAAGVVNATVMDDITRLFQEYKVFSWNGFSGSDLNVMDGYSFDLAAEYDEGELKAIGYEKYPSGYKEGHAVLAEYLAELAETIGAPEFTDRNEITYIMIALPEEVYISLLIYGEDITILYEYGETRETLSIDDVGQKKFDEFVDFVLDYYARCKDEALVEGANADSYLHITANSELLGVFIDNDISLDDIRFAEDNEKLKAMALQLAGKTPDGDPLEDIAGSASIE